MFRILGLFLVTLMLVGCAVSSGAVKDPNARPAWVDDPRRPDAITALGSAGRHINGRQAQRDLAVQRAIDELARQTKVRVSSHMRVASSANNMSSSSSLDSLSYQNVDGQTVSATIEAEWHDRQNDIFYVLMSMR